LRILLAEDSLVNQKLAFGLLERYGHVVEIANNGHEALSSLADASYDLVLMDVQMPEMDGLEATTLIRARERLKGGHVPIVAMTACAMQGDRERCLSAGMDGYLAKPIRAAQLLETVHDVLQRGRGPEARQEAGPAGESAVDWQKALGVVQADQGLLRDVVQLFLQEAPQWLGAVRSSIGEGDMKVLQQTAHTIKGSLRFLGTQNAVDMAYELECIGRERRFHEATEQSARLADLIERMIPELTAFVRTGHIPNPAGQA
jgi:CheY-like chemotaxis protein/HPt (histidine-containing phosphotransfer) domain-containing protein